jgi:hypothetical protein
MWVQVAVLVVGEMQSRSKVQRFEIILCTASQSWNQQNIRRVGTTGPRRAGKERALHIIYISFNPSAAVGFAQLVQE